MATRNLSDYLRRFRPAAAPGAAGPAGVPSDVVVELEAELSPVFAELEASLRQAEAVENEARAQALRIAREASARVVSIDADGRRDAAQARVEASTGRERLAEEERRRLRSTAEEGAAGIDARAARRASAVVDRVVEIVLDDSESAG